MTAFSEMPVPSAPLQLRLASPIGRYQLSRMVKGGLPASLLTPFQFLLGKRLAADEEIIVKKIEDLRFQLALRTNEQVSIFRDPKSSRVTRPLVRFLNETAYISSVHAQWGTFLHLCANSIEAKTILELGSSAGISGCYLASTKCCRRFITIEGSEALASLATTHLGRIAKNFEVVNASFNDALDDILPKLEDRIDMIYLDGEKDRASNLQYFARLTPHLRAGGVIVLDDIHWSAEMRGVWKTVRRIPGFLCTIDAGRLGVCVWRGGTIQPRTWTLFQAGGINLFELRRHLRRIRPLHASQ